MITPLTYLIGTAVVFTAIGGIYWLSNRLPCISNDSHNKCTEQNKQGIINDSKQEKDLTKTKPSFCSKICCCCCNKESTKDLNKEEIKLLEKNN